jgi:hypothetical protein
MRRSNLNQLNSNDRHILAYYTNLYNQQLREINMMYNELKEIKNNIDTITGVNNIRRQPLRNIYYRMDYIPIPDLENVPIVASQDIINRNTRSVRFDEVVNPLNYDCPISLERFQSNSILTQIIGCNHLFCTNEITRWFRSNVHCPVCRYDIREIDNNIQEEPTEEVNNTNTDNNSISTRRSNLYRTYSTDISLNEITENLINSFFSNYSLYR